MHPAVDHHHSTAAATISLNSDFYSPSSLLLRMHSSHIRSPTPFTTYLHASLCSFTQGSQTDISSTKCSSLPRALLPLSPPAHSSSQLHFSSPFLSQTLPHRYHTASQHFSVLLPSKIASHTSPCQYQLLILITTA